jgi:hypothetical protein
MFKTVREDEATWKIVASSPSGRESEILTCLWESVNDAETFANYMNGVDATLMHYKNADVAPEGVGTYLIDDPKHIGCSYILIKCAIICPSCGSLRAFRSMLYAWAGTSQLDYDGHPTRLSPGDSIKHYATLCSDCGEACWS